MITREQLRFGQIVGVVDSHDVADSKFTGECLEHHSAHWTQTRCRWRWNDTQGINWLTAECRPNEEQHEVIRRHLRRKYGIRFDEHGLHDSDYLWEDES